MDFFEKISKGDAEKIAQAEQLFIRILSGKKGSLEDRLQVTKLIDLARGEYGIDTELKNNPEAFKRRFHPRYFASMKQVEIFMDESTFLQALHADTSEQVWSNIASILIFITAVSLYEMEREKALKPPPLMPTKTQRTA